MVSCRFSLKPIHWYIQNIPKYQPMGSTWSTWYRLWVTSESTGSSHTSAEISLFSFCSWNYSWVIWTNRLCLCWVWTSMLSLDFHEFLDEVSELNILEKNGTGRWLEFQANPMFGWFWDDGICKTGPFSCWRIPPSVFLPQFANDAKHGSPVRFTMEILVPKVPMERICKASDWLAPLHISWLETHQIFVTWSKHMVFDVFVCLPRSGLSSLPFKKAFIGPWIWESHSWCWGDHAPYESLLIWPWHMTYGYVWKPPIGQ